MPCAETWYFSSRLPPTGVQPVPWWRPEQERLILPPLEYVSRECFVEIVLELPAEGAATITMRLSSPGSRPVGSPLATPRSSRNTVEGRWRVFSNMVPLAKV